MLEAPGRGPEYRRKPIAGATILGVTPLLLPPNDQ
jgi:hypothetical protein